MENGDALYARIAELEKKNDVLEGMLTLSACFLSEELQNDLKHLREYPRCGEKAIANLKHNSKYFSKYYKKADSEKEEEVRCSCPKCHAEGKCHVSKRRSLELQVLGLDESCCPFGDRCAASDSDSDSDSDEESDEGPKKAKVNASPSAQQFCRDNGLDITKFTGSGVEGRIILKDVKGK